MALFKNGQFMIYQDTDHPQGLKCYDFKNRCFLGVKGTPITRLSSVVKADKTSAEYHAITHCNTDVRDWLEVLISLGGHCHAQNDCELLPISQTPRTQWSKTIQSYMQEMHTSFIDLREFMYYIKFYSDNNKKYANKMNYKTYKSITQTLYLPDYSEQDLDVLLYYFCTRNGDTLAQSNILLIVHAYITQCHKLGITPVKDKNPFRLFVETAQSYNALAENSDNSFTEVYQKHAKAWEFEYGDFIVTIPQNGQDLVREGLEMHHCVGSYVDRVSNGDTYICFIRDKYQPEIPYITCQVNVKGMICQYYLSYDRCISTDRDILFKQEFQKHLSEVWEKEEQ